MSQYEIIIRDETTSTLKSPIANSEDGQAKDTTGNKNQNEGRMSPWAYMAYRRVESVAKSWINHEISMVSVRTGRVELQQRWQFAADTAFGIVDTVTNIAVGAKVGGGVGAVVGAVVSVAQAGINLAQKLDRHNTQMYLENTSLGLMNVRAGGSLATYSQSRQ